MVTTELKTPEFPKINHTLILIIQFVKLTKHILKLSKVTLSTDIYDETKSQPTRFWNRYQMFFLRKWP